MIRIRRLLLKPNNNTQHAWKAPLSVVSLAVIATLSVATSNFQANADDTDQKNPSLTVEEVITYARAEVTQKTADALLSGKMTPADAAKKMISFEVDVVDKMEYLRGMQQTLKHAVDSGEMTREEAVTKWGPMLLKDKKENSGNERVNAYLKEVSSEIKEAVANGTMTSEEGKAKYAEAEAQMAQQSVRNKRLEAYLEKVGAEIKEAVANGTMTPEEGKAKYAETVEDVKQRMMGAKSKDKSKLITKEAYDEAAAKMARMVKAGEITLEQKHKLLDVMRRVMDGQQQKPITKEDRVTVAEIIKMLNAGEITREQMQQRLDRIFALVNDAEARAIWIGDSHKILDDYCMRLRELLQNKIRDKSITYEKAVEIWEEKGC